MIRSQLASSILLGAIALGICVAVVAAPASAEVGQERQRLAQSGPEPAPAASPALAEELAAAMGAPLDWLSGARFNGAAAQAASVPAFGAIGPLAGDRLAVISTGDASAGSARPGSAYHVEGTDGPTRLTLSFDPPAGGRQLSFRYRFLSAEFPEFSASHADHFRVFVTDSDGRREIEHIDAGNPALIPVSADNARDTAFALFTDIPGQVSGAFDFGLPAAGLTPWQRVSAGVAQSGPVTVEFEIADNGDQFIDSAVLIDTFSLSATSLVHPASAAPQNLNEALDCLFQGGPVVGAVADGLTPIIFSFFNLPGPGTVTFTLPGSTVPDDGGYGPIGGSDRLAEVTVSTQFGPNGHEGRTQYLVPEEFNKGGNENQASRNVTFRAFYVPDDPELNEQTVNLPFQLWRPPVILMHGLWSSAADAWGNSPLRTDSRLRTFTGDYKSTNASWFAVNTLQPATPIRDACNAMWNGMIALSQVDYVGHSMGGIVGRNFNGQVSGLVNKFFTVNTPHTGSPLGNLVVSIRNWADERPEWIRSRIYALFSDNLGDIDKGALDDLSKGSSGIAAIPPTSLPSHALVGVGGSDLVGDALAQAPGKLGVLFKIINFIDDNTDLFEGIQHDLIVGRLSQEGGISSSAKTVFNGLHSIHTNAPGSEQYRDRIVELLNSDQTGSAFSTFPAPGSLPRSTGPELVTLGDPGNEFTEFEIEILQPTAGQVFAPGDSIQFSVGAVGDFDLESVLIFSPEDGLEVNSAPFQGSLDIPLSYLGPMQIAAMGRSSNGTITFSEEIEVMVETDLTLNAIEVVQRNPVLFDFTDRRQLAVMGTFSDGIVRDVSGAATGTAYTSNNENIVRVTEDGELVPVSEGQTTVVVQNGALQDSITVQVNEILFLFIDRFEQ